ncbi:MAG: hypothetical protein JNL21_22500, partial [Myxococcales bacterium]|nr:hypothetical protein [Myxococcales bacterium]
NAGGGGEAGGGPMGGGGMAPCEPSACQDCLSGALECPLVGRDPGDFVASLAGAAPAVPNVFITDGLEASDASVRLLGTFSSSMLVLPSETLTADGVLQSGFVLDGSGNAVFAAGPCDDDDAPGGADNEVFFNAITESGSRLVVAGAFESGRLIVFGGASTGNTLDCSDSNDGIVEGPATTQTELTPMLLWLDLSHALDRWLVPADVGSTNENGYLADVAPFPSSANGTVAAVGMAMRNPFLAMPSFGGEDRYFVVVSDGVTEAEVEPLDWGLCDSNQFVGLAGLKSSIAVDASSRIWVAGAGCPVGSPDDSTPRGFLGRLTTVGESPVGFPLVAPIGDGFDPIEVTEIGLTETRVILAGTYSGAPIAGVEPGSDDAFVMAYDQASFGTQSQPVWFRRIGSDLGPVQVDRLVVADGRIFVAGVTSKNISVGASSTCITSDPLDGGRAFFAELREQDGALGWAHLDGFESGSGTFEFSARGTAIVPQTGGLLTATSTRGSFDLGCNGPATSPTAAQGWVRRFDFPN